MGHGKCHFALFVRIAASHDGSLAPAAFAAGPFLPLLAAGLPRAGAQTTQPALPETEAPALPLPTTRLGDFDMMKERRLIRILVPFSRTIYFLDNGAERGTAAEFGRQFEAWLNKKYKTKALKIRIAFIPTPRDKLLSDLNAGLGDIVAANLTITPERQQIVDFSAPGLRGVKEVIVTGPGAPALASLDDLAGRELHVRQSSSYWTHLAALNAKLAVKGLKEITLYPAMRIRGRGSARDGECRSAALHRGG